MLGNIIAIAYYAYVVLVILTIISEDRDPADAAFWLVVVIAFPIVGLILFLLLGRDWRKTTVAKKRYFRNLTKARNRFIVKLYESYSKYSNDFKQRNRGKWILGVIKFTEITNEMPLLPADDIKILPSGGIKFPALEKDLSEAKNSIHLQYFIWERDELTKQITEILLKKLGEGIEVRIMYDWAGSLNHKKDEIRKLKKAGAKIVSDIREIGKLNYRNHRKIAIIDGAIGYTGGLNMGQEYIDGGVKYPAWRDTHLRITGPFVYSLQDLFAARWYFRTKESLYKKRYFPATKVPSNPIMLQLSYSGVDLPWDITKRAYVKMIENAKEKIYIQSPYFIPDQALFESLTTAALSGVDVRLMMTGWPDKKSVWHAAQTFFEKFLLAGGKIYYYNKGFFHAKALSIDEEITSIGTTNFDIRSFHLHNEDTVFIFDKKTIKRQYKIFSDDLKECMEFTLKDYQKIGRLARFRNSLTRLFSNLF